MVDRFARRLGQSEPQSEHVFKNWLQSYQGVCADHAGGGLAQCCPHHAIANLAAKTLKELIDLIKSNPGKYSYAQPAPDSTPHLAGELFKQEFGLDLVTVPFNGAGPAINSTMGGYTPIAFTALPPTMGPSRAPTCAASSTSGETPKGTVQRWLNWVGDLHGCRIAFAVSASRQIHNNRCPWAAALSL